MCGWTLPAAKKQQFIDRDHQLGIVLYQCSALARRIETQYQQTSLVQVNQRDEPCLAWSVLTLMMEVAPLPVGFWCERLNDKAPLERQEDQIVIRISHPKSLSYFDDTEPVSFTYYAMTPMAARVFTQWQQSQPGALNVEKITHALNQFLGASTDPALTPLQWQRCLQALWLHRFRLPPEVLNDFSNPMRHVSPLPRRASDETQSHSVDVDVDTERTLAAMPRKAKKTADLFSRWPHKALIKHLASPSQPKQNQPDWDTNNLLPRLLFDYVEELVEFGDVKKSDLSVASIERYSNFKKEFSHAPLSFDIAGDRTSLQAWAAQRYEALEPDSLDQWRMYQFFRFMTQQPFTEHLDLSDFIKPTHSVKIDALTLSADEVHQLITSLLEQVNSPIQSLFSAVGTLLAYYGQLRRGEVIRLRLQDIRCVSHQGQRFHLEIQNTKEGTTKNGQSRTVHVVMPEIAAKLVRVVLDMKKHASPASAFIGLNGESIALRARLYLLPITKGLKYWFGKKARFHHLRHSGAQLLYQQALCLACDHTPESWRRPNQPITNELFSMPMVKQRFDYWLEGRDFAQMNNMLLFDEVGRELGHHYYATTRLHYLHGMEWVAQALLPQQREYSHAELRFMLGLKLGSNDVARHLSQLDPHYAALSIQEKKTHRALLTHQALMPLIASRLALPVATNNLRQEADVQTLDHHFWLSLWMIRFTDLEQQTSGLHYHWEGKPLIQKLRLGEVVFEDLRDLWCSFGQYQGITLSPTQRQTLSVLGVMSLKDTSKGACVSVQCPCNQKIKKALAVLKQSGLRYHAHIALHQNRKRLESDKWSFVQEHLVHHHDSATKVVVPMGKTHLTITFRFFTTNAALLTPFVDWWNQLLLHK